MQLHQRAKLVCSAKLEGTALYTATNQRKNKFKPKATGKSLAKIFPDNCPKTMKVAQNSQIILKIA